MREPKAIELLKLCEEYPDLPIKALVDNEVVGDNYGIWLGEVSKMYVGEVGIDDTGYDCEYYTDREEYKEDYYERNCDEICNKCTINGVVNEQEIDKYLEEKANETFEKAIIVYIN